MKRFILSLTFAIVATINSANAQLIFAPYYIAEGRMNNNGKISWEQYEEIRSSSIFISQGKIEFNRLRRNNDVHVVLFREER